ncbi:MAG: rod shape-determining protein RodA [Spirulinaceae cyanobacterium]
MLFGLIVGVTAFGGLVIYSTNDGADYYLKHLTAGIVGIGCGAIIARLRYEVLIHWHWFIYGATNFLLLAVKFFGTRTNGAQSWLDLGGIEVQPSEFAKLGVIITLAALLHQRPASTLGAVFRTLAITAVPWLLIFIQPDLGTSLVFGAITLGMLFWGGANPGWLVLMISPIASAILFNVYFPAWCAWLALMALTAWLTLPWKWISSGIALGINGAVGGFSFYLWQEVLQDYQKARITSFLDPSKDALGTGYHLIQSRIAIGSGELWGRGLTGGTQTQLDFIPEQHTDFIFSAVGEEWGFIGCIVLLFAFSLICLRLVIIAVNAQEDFGSLLAIGVLSMIAFQTILNISMTIGLAPITGIPLPFLSYGRSALLTNFLSIGLVEAVANSRLRSSF